MFRINLVSGYIDIIDIYGQSKPDPVPPVQSEGKKHTGEKAILQKMEKLQNSKEYL